MLWPVELTHYPWPSPLVPASLDGFYSGRSLDGEPPPLRAREVVSLPWFSQQPGHGFSQGGRAEKESSPGLPGRKAPFLPVSSWKELVAGWPWAEVRGMWDPGDRDLCPNPTLCVFSCQGTCCVQYPGCCPYSSCHLSATGGDGTLGRRCVPLPLQVSLASLPALHTRLTPAWHSGLTGFSAPQAPGEKHPAAAPNATPPL